MSSGLKKYNTIGCCGIDCGLCPRFISKSNSACPGCGSIAFEEKHPSCGFLTCCAKKHRLEVCAECEDFPCKRFDSEQNGYDSFVTHKKIFPNQQQIKDTGIISLLEEQKHRIEILDYLISNYDNGRSKSFFCQTCTLFPIRALDKLFQGISITENEPDFNERNKAVHSIIQRMANELGLDLKLRKKARQDNLN